MPDPAEEDKEIVIQHQKYKALKVTKEFIEHNCDEVGNVKDADNLTESEKKGRKEIIEGIKTKDWIIYETGKSGKTVLDTKQNYLEVMKKHFEKDKVVDMKEVTKDERILNQHS